MFGRGPQRAPERSMSPNVFSVGGSPREAKGHPIPFIEMHENVFSNRRTRSLSLPILTHISPLYANAGKNSRGAGTR
jgi:hypothetical protein